MIRQKLSGERLRNRDVLNEDRISELPEALTLQILCLLPLKIAITTSVLSKQWKSHWKQMPKLKFDSYDYKLELETLSKNVFKSLRSHKAPILQSFYLKARLDRCKVLDIETMIGIAFARNVRKLVLEVVDGQVLEIPRSLYNCETLETLKLKGDILMDVPSSVHMKSLRTLQLHLVKFKGDESVVNLLSGCLNLEDLTVHRNLHSKVKTFIIAVPSLERLTIYSKNCGRVHWGYVINAPSLKYLKIDRIQDISYVPSKDLKNETLWSFGYCLIENTKNLVDANIVDIYQKTNENLLESLTSVKRLTLDLSPYKIKSPMSSIFYQLVCLELYTYKNAWWNLLTQMLDSSPELKVLKLIDQSDMRKHRRDHMMIWNQPKKVPECLLFHLETLIWKGYEWKRGEEREVAGYILSNTNCLKKAIFSFKPIDSKMRPEMIEELQSVVRASSSCQLLFETQLHV